MLANGSPEAAGGPTGDPLRGSGTGLQINPTPSGVRRSMLFSAADRYVTLVVNLVLTAVVARLLTPEEIGIFAVGAAFLAVIEALREFGAPTYIVQERDLTREDVRTTATVMFVLAFAVSASLVAGAPALASFYGDLRLGPILQVSAGGVLIGAVSGPFLALLRRNMEFRALAVINVTAILANATATIGLILLGWGAMSLVVALFIANVVVAVGAFASRPEPWILRPCLKGWRRVLGFGSYASATACLNVLHGVLPQLLLGRLLGLDSAGLYNRAAMLCQLPDRAVISAVQPVILPAFARQVRAGADLRMPYLRALSLLSAVHWPILACMAIGSDVVVRVLLGTQWDAASPVVRVLCTGSMAMVAAPLTYPVLVATGRVRDTLTSSLISLPLSAMAMVVAAPYGMLAIASTTLVTLPFQAFVAIWLIRRQIRFGWGEFTRAFGESAVVTLMTMAVPVGCRLAFGPLLEMAAPAQVLAIVGAGLGWLAGLVVTRHPLWVEVRHAWRRISSVARLPGWPAPLRGR